MARLRVGARRHGGRVTAAYASYYDGAVFSLSISPNGQQYDGVTAEALGSPPHTLTTFAQQLLHVAPARAHARGGDAATLLGARLPATREGARVAFGPGDAARVVRARLVGVAFATTERSGDDGSGEEEAVAWALWAAANASATLPSALRPGGGPPAELLAGGTKGSVAVGITINDQQFVPLDNASGFVWEYPELCAAVHDDFDYIHNRELTDPAPDYGVHRPYWHGWPGGNFSVACATVRAPGADGNGVNDGDDAAADDDASTSTSTTASYTYQSFLFGGDGARATAPPAGGAERSLTTVPLDTRYCPRGGTVAFQLRYLAPSCAASGDDAADDDAADDDDGGADLCCAVDAVAIAGAEYSPVALQFSTDGANWATLARFLLDGSVDSRSGVVYSDDDDDDDDASRAAGDGGGAWVTQDSDRVASAFANYTLRLPLEHVRAPDAIPLESARAGPLLDERRHCRRGRAVGARLRLDLVPAHAPLGYRAARVLAAERADPRRDHHHRHGRVSRRRRS